MDKLLAYKNDIEEFLASAIPCENPALKGLADSMNYSLMAGGKRIRPILVLEFASVLNEPEENVLPIACAVEMVHTYSLIHDDLPCMDNDDLRRGKPTNHKVFGECTATLAGDALQPLAFQTILQSSLPNDRKVKCAQLLAEAIGYLGMCGGQFEDTIGENKLLSTEELTEINLLKTGALLSAACQIGVAAAGGNEKQLKAAKEFGSCLGLAFQVRDDMLDVLSTDATLGKPIGSDEENHKNTYMKLLGEENCAAYVHDLTQQALNSLHAEFFDCKLLEDLAKSLETRKY